MPDKLEKVVGLIDYMKDKDYFWRKIVLKTSKNSEAKNWRLGYFILDVIRPLEREHKLKIYVFMQEKENKLFNYFEDSINAWTLST